MKERDKRYLAAAAAAMLAAGLICTGMDAAEERAVQAVTVEPVPAYAVVVVPPQPEPAEDPAEDDLVVEQLKASDYLRDDVPMSYELQAVLHDACEEYGVPYELALGVIQVESNFCADADGGSCYGLMQLNTGFFPAGLEPGDNIRAGVKFLGELLDRYRDAGAALTAYNAGHDTGNRRYAKAVLRAAEGWSQGGEDTDGQ